MQVMHDKSKESPDWYGKRCDSYNKLCGYGKGESLDKANALAMASLSKKSDVWIETNVEIGKTKNSSIGSEVKTKKYFKQKTRIRAQRELENPIQLNQEKIDNFYFVKWMVDLRPKWQQLTDRLTEKWSQEGQTLPGDIEWEGWKGLTSSRLLELTKRQLQNNGDPSTSKDINVLLYRKTGKWILSVGRVNLEIDDLSEVIDLSVYASEESKLKIINENGKNLGQRLSSGDRFYLRLKGISPNWYCSFLNVYPDGRISVLKENLPIKGKDLTIPDSNSTCLQAATLKPDKISLDIYCAVCTKYYQEGLTNFRLLKDKGALVDGESAYQVDSFMEWLEDLKKNNFSVLRVETTP